MSENIPRIHGNGSVAEDWPRIAPETKHEKFLRLAPKRMQAALDAMDRVSRLGATEYEYGEQEEALMVSALRAKLTEVENRLARKKAQKQLFSFG
jgi:hypothetical protein